MKRDLILRVDSLIDGTRIRNRSHALEYIVSKYFKPKIHKALILAGGEGVKMRPFTYELPKTMLPVKGRPILEHILDLLRSHDIRELFVALPSGSQGDKVKDHFGDGSKFGVKINYIIESRKMGTGGSLKNAISQIGTDPFILIYSDVLAELDLGDLIEFHLEASPVLTVALTSVEDPTDYGVVRLHGDNIVEYKEKPRKSLSMSHLVSAGVYIVDHKILDFIPDKSVSSLEEDIVPKLIKNKKIKGYLFEGQWFDVGTPEIYQRAIKEWNN